MQINRKQLRYIYNRFGFTRPSFAYYPENSATPGKRATYGEARVGIMTNGEAGVMVEQGTENLIPLAKQKFEGWAAYRDAVVTLTQGIAVPEWGAVDATRIQTSGGTHALKYLLGVETPPAGAVRSEQVWVKNIGNNSVRVASNLGSRQDTVLPGESRLVKFEKIFGTGNSTLQMDLRAGNAADSLDFIAWRPMAEANRYCTSWTDGTRSPETLSVPVLFEREGEIEFTAEITDKCKRHANTLPAGMSPILIQLRDATLAGGGIWVYHSELTARFFLETFTNTGTRAEYVIFDDSLIPNGTRTLKISITTSAVILYCDGAEIARIDNPTLPSAWGRAHLGSIATGTNHADAMFGGIKIMDADSTVLSDILFNGPDFIRKARKIQL